MDHDPSEWTDLHFVRVRVRFPRIVLVPFPNSLGFHSGCSVQRLVGHRLPSVHFPGGRNDSETTPETRGHVVQVLYVSWRWNTMLTYGNDTENHRYVFGVIGLALYG